MDVPSIQEKMYSYLTVQLYSKWKGMISLQKRDLEILVPVQKKKWTWALTLLENINIWGGGKEGGGGGSKKNKKE